MAKISVFYEPDTQLLSIFWHPPRKNQICTELGDGLIPIEDDTSGETLGLEILNYQPGDPPLAALSLELAQAAAIAPQPHA